MAGLQQLELSRKVRDRVRLMQWDVLNVSLSSGRTWSKTASKRKVGVVEQWRL